MGQTFQQLLVCYNQLLPPILSGARFERSLTRRTGFKLVFSALSAQYLRAAESSSAPDIPDFAKNIPPRAPQALTGSQFAESVSSMDRQQREVAILGQLLDGNLPGFLRKLVPVKLSCGLGHGQIAAVAIFVMPEYLAIGSDNDFLRIPMNFHTATAVARRFGFVLPTRKIVDAIYHQSSCRFNPQPLPAGPQMTSTGYYRVHNAMIDKQSQSRGFSNGALIAGHKKDVVLSNRLRLNPDRIAIYGWHRGPGEPIQPLSTVHGAGYADYSHGIRLIAGMAITGGRLTSISDILQDSLLASLLSDEGVIRDAATLGAI